MNVYASQLPTPTITIEAPTRWFSTHSPSRTVDRVIGTDGEKRTTSSLLLQHGKAEKQARHVIPPVPLGSEGDSKESVIKKRMRHCMRRVPQAATIVTSTNINDPGNPWRGATVSSFTTVTFEPEVIVSLNLKLPSTTFDAIQTSNRFDVNMLKASDEGGKIASRFARGHAASPFSDGGTQASIIAARSSDQPFEALPPLLSRARGIQNPIAFRISCIYLPQKTVQLGDHVVIFGTVDSIPSKDYDRSAKENDTCLAYVDGCYGQVEPLLKQPQEESNGIIARKDVTQAKSPDQTSTMDLGLVSTPMTPLQPYRKMPLQKMPSKKVGSTVRCTDRGRGPAIIEKSGHKSLQPSQHGELQLPTPKSMRTVRAETSASCARIDSGDHHAVDEPTVADQLDSNRTKRLIFGKVATAGQQTTDVHPPIRPNLVDYPPFRKIFTGPNPLAVERDSPKTQNDEANNMESNDINSLIQKVLVRKHYTTEKRVKEDLVRKHLGHGSQPFVLSTSADEAHLSSTSTAAPTADVEALIKSLLHGSGFRIRTHLSNGGSDARPGIPPDSHMSGELHQVLRDKIRNAIRQRPYLREVEADARRATALQEQQQKEEAEQKIQKLAMTEVMQRDIEDIMGQIQEYFKSRSKEEADKIFDHQEKLRSTEGSMLIEDRGMTESG